MKSFGTMALAVLALCAGLWNAEAATKGRSRARRSRAVMYRMKDDASPAELARFQAILRKHKITERRQLVRGRVRLGAAASPLSSEEQIAQDIMSTGAVEFAEPDYLVEPVLVPNDPSYGSQWFHSRIESAAAWNSCTGSSQVVVAVCDTGVESAHPDLAANMKLPGYNSVDGSSNTEPVYSHGTRVAGCIGAVGNNGVGVAGVCWNVKILPIRITNRTDGWAYTSDMAEGIRWAADHGARVANLSYSGAGSSTINSAAQYLRDKGGLLFMSAGNDGAEQTTYPDFPAFIAVGSVNTGDSRSSFSNYGAFIDIVAPGEGITSTTTGGGYSSSSGTSFSSPIAAGLGALLFAADPGLTPAEMEQIIFSSCKDLGTAGNDNVYGHGRIDAGAALASLAPPSPNNPPTAAAQADPESGHAPLTVNFDAGASSDSDGTIVSSEWEFDDGADGSGATVSHTFAVAGSYAVTLTVTDDDGATASDVVVITVDAPLLRDVAITGVEAAASATRGDPVTVTVTAENLGDVAESFMVNLDEAPDGAAVGQSQVTDLAPGAAKEITFTWQTGSASAGNHTLVATAATVPNETATADNIRTALVMINAPATPPLPDGTGLAGEYFHNMDLTSPALSRTDATVDFSWPRGTSPDASIQEESFSVRWSGQVEALYSESYRFYTLSDDGVRLWVGGHLLVDNWTNHGATENSGVVQLEAGVKFDVVMEFFENTGDATAKLLWSSVSQVKETVPQACLFPATISTPPPAPEPDGDGLLGEYFNNMDLTGPVMIRTDATIDFAWARGTSPDASMGDETFSVRWSGQVMALHSETHTFYTLSDDGIRVWVDGRKIIDNWTNHGATENSGSLALAEGEKYDIIIEYYENAVDAVAKLYWSSPSITKALVPTAYLFSASTGTPPPPPPPPPPAPDGVGLLGEYFNKMDLTDPALTRIDPTVDFAWGRGGSPAPIMSSDKFSVRWSGQVEPEFTETYTLYTATDDGVRLWVDGRKIIDNWTDHSLTESTATIALTGGKRVDIVMEYYEKTGDAVARLLWSSPSQAKQVVPQLRLYPASGGAEPPPNPGGDGLRGEYFHNMDLTSPALTRTDAAVNFTWPRGTAPAASINEETFSVRWSGKVQPLYSDTYTFHTVSDDGVRLWVNGQKIVDNWTNHAATENGGTTTLQAGVKYTIVMEYYENQYDATAQLLWSSPSRSKQIIPTACLFTQ
jgi:PKD repeat protein